MKKILINSLLTCQLTILLTSQLWAQSIGINTNTPDVNAALEIRSNTKGLLIPRMSSTLRIIIQNPATGLMVYDSSSDGFWYHSNLSWLEMATHSSAWRLDGNGNVNSAYNFLGTTNNQPVRLRLANLWGGELNHINNNYSIGQFAGKSISSGFSNVALGDRALFTNSSGFGNTAMGQTALFDNISGDNNAAIGVSALLHTTGSKNTAAGAYALFNNVTGNYNTALGYSAIVGSEHNLEYATVIGSGASVNCSHCLALGGTVFNGAQTYVGINTQNPSFSLDILEINNTGLALRNPTDVVGAESKISSWEIYHAPNPYPNLPGQGGDLVLFYNNFLGNSPRGAFDHASGAYSSLSDKRMKTNIQPMQPVMEKIKLLKAASYEFVNNNPGHRESIGLIAQEVGEIFPELIHPVNTENKTYDELLTLDYSSLGALAIKGVQEQQEIIELHQRQIDEMKKEILLLEVKN